MFNWICQIGEMNEHIWSDIVANVYMGNVWCLSSILTAKIRWTKLKQIKFYFWIVNILLKYGLQFRATLVRPFYQRCFTVLYPHSSFVALVCWTHSHHVLSFSTLSFLCIPKPDTLHEIFSPFIALNYCTHTKLLYL